MGPRATIVGPKRLRMTMMMTTMTMRIFVFTRQDSGRTHPHTVALGPPGIPGDKLSGERESMAERQTELTHKRQDTVTNEVTNQVTK